MIGTGSSEQKASSSEQSHCPKINFAVATQGRGNGCAGLRERRRIQNDHPKLLATPLHGTEGFECIGFAPLDVAEAIEGGVHISPVQSVAAGIERHHLVSLLGEVKSKRAVIGKAVQSPASPRHQLFAEDPVRALVQKRTGLLPLPRCREVANGAFPNLDLLRNRPKGYL